MPTLELIKFLVSTGELGLLAAVLIGIFKLADKYIPQALAAYAAHTAAIVQLSTILPAKIDEAVKAINEARARASESAEDVAEMRGVLATGQHPAVTEERLGRPPFPTNPDRRR